MTKSWPAIFLCVGLLPLSPVSSAEEKAKEGSGKKWVSLFDGKNLDEWKARAEGDVTAEDGEIRILTKANLWLVNDKSFSNFELEVEAFMPESGYNSGIGFRCQGEKKPMGYQCEIENQKSGSVYAIGKGWVWPKSKDGFPDFYKEAGDAFKVGEWNRFRIRCTGDHIQIWVNEVKVTDIHDDKFTKGSVALQHHGKGEVHRFRKIRIRELE